MLSAGVGRWLACLGDWCSGLRKIWQFFQTHRAPTFKPLSEGHTIGDKIQPLQSEIPNNARISASSHGWDIGHQPSIA